MKTVKFIIGLPFFILGAIFGLLMYSMSKGIEWADNYIDAL